MQIHCKKLSQVALLIGVTLISMRAFATTYYIDYSSGNDGNTGTSKSTPWQRLPGMQGVGGNAAAHNPVPGDNFILKGGVTWPANNFGMQMVYTGSSSSSSPVGCVGPGCIYIGVDQSWYAGGSWTRPIFDGGGTQAAAYPGGLPSAVVDLYGGYFILDNIEFAHWAQTSNSPGSPSIVSMRGTHEETKNSYFHGWSHSGSASQDNMQLFGGGASCPPDMTESIHDNVADGSDTSGDMIEFAHPGAGYIYNNYIANVHNGVVGSATYVFQNTFLHVNWSFDTTSHGNVIESTGCQLIAYNNYSSDANGGASIFNTPHDGMVDYDFNNVFDAQQNQTIQIDGNGLSSGAGSGIYVFNNTLQSPSGTPFPLIDGPTRGGTLPFMIVYNNYLIGDNPTVNFATNVSNKTQSNNIGQSNATASSKGFLLGSIFPFLSAAGATVGTGTSASTMAPICASIPSGPVDAASTACMSDSTVGVGYNTSTHSVIVPNRASTVRPGTWSVGAYEVGGSGSSQGAPMPPAGLTATVQ